MLCSLVRSFRGMTLSCLRGLVAASWLVGKTRSLVPMSGTVVDTGCTTPALGRTKQQIRRHNHCTAPRRRHGGRTERRWTMLAGRGGGRTGGGRAGRAPGRGRKPSPFDAFDLGGEERLQKFLSHAGLESRRQCEQMILDGRVKVNGKMVTQLGIKVDPRRDQVHVDGERVFMRPRSEIKWVAINKPKGVICTVSDELGRPCAVDVVPRGRDLRLVPVGRLDRDSCGLLLMTNENSWINPLTHPSYGHEKTYRVSITSGYPNQDEWNTLTQGMLLDGDPNPTRPCIVEVVDYDRRTLVTSVNVIIREGKNRQIRRMFEGIGHDVKSITRIAHGPIRLKGLRPGEWRALEGWEVEKLKNLTTKTLKSPRKAQSSRGSNRSVASSRSPRARSQTDALDEEEDEWNKAGVLSRKAVVHEGRAGSTRDDELEWHTTSWAREAERKPDGGRPPKKTGKAAKKLAISEGDRILEMLAKGEELKAPAWEGGGKVERDGRRSLARGKGTWTPAKRR